MKLTAQSVKKDFPRAVLGLLRKAADDGAGVLLVTHEDEAAQFADRVYVMDGGRLCLTPSAE